MADPNNTPIPTTNPTPSTTPPPDSSTLTPSSHEIKTVGVVATGVIGASFTALCLSRGLYVLACSTSLNAEGKLADYLDRVMPTIEVDDDDVLQTVGNNNDKNVGEKWWKSKYEFVGKTLDGHWERLDFVQENAPENLPLKRSIFAHLDAHLPAHVPVASSSSGFPASLIASSCTRHPERVLVGHCFNPPHIVPLIEVVPSSITSSTITDKVMSFYRDTLHKQPIHVKQETPGFIVNRLQFALMREASNLVLRGVVTAEEIDTCVTASIGPRWSLTGPFLLTSLAGVPSGASSGDLRAGYKRLLTHLLPAQRIWARDIEAHNVLSFDDEEAQARAKMQIEVLDSSVQDMLDGIVGTRGDDTPDNNKTEGDVTTEFIERKDVLLAELYRRQGEIWEKKNK